VKREAAGREETQRPAAALIEAMISPLVVPRLLNAITIPFLRGDSFPANDAPDSLCYFYFISGEDHFLSHPLNNTPCPFNLCLS
jgi:hypothetical protein